MPNGVMAPKTKEVNKRRRKCIDEDLLCGDNKCLCFVNNNFLGSQELHPFYDFFAAIGLGLVKFAY